VEKYYGSSTFERSFLENPDGNFPLQKEIGSGVCGESVSSSPGLFLKINWMK
jgi:hypothetical protein